MNFLTNNLNIFLLLLLFSLRGRGCFTKYPNLKKRGGGEKGVGC